ncbi:MAG: hypothetical protein QNK23_08235 [Crocinitomicaceae bacterium]|nr:hypothetical protein [Crocinitomicaceae bacterium]
MKNTIKTLIALSLLLVMAGNVNSQTTVTVIFDTPGAGTWTVPCGVTGGITIAVYGAGGGGGGANSNTQGGGGGGAGGYAQSNFFIGAGTIVPFSVGLGGVGGGPAGSGNTGGQTNLQPMFAMRGFGGVGGQPENAPGLGAGGIGGIGQNGAIMATGGTGGTGTVAIGGQGGSAGGPNGGGGGPGGGGGANGGNGGNYGGGGGGGGRKSGGVNTFGGSGANGAVVITYTTNIIQPSAGLDVSTCNVVFLDGNAPSPGWTGTWVVTSATGPYTITDINDPNTNLSITNPSTCVTLEWQFTMAGCVDIIDEVTICYPALCNDDPCGAIALPVGSAGCVSTVYSNVLATASTAMVEPGCGDWSDNDAWYSAVVPASGVVTINATDNTGGGTMEMGMAIYSEGPGGCNDVNHEGCDFATSTGDVAEITYTGTPGETIYIMVWDVDETESDYQLCAFEPSAAFGDITPGFTTVGCGGASQSFFDPGGDGGNYEVNTTAYYTLCPDTPGQFVTVDFTTGSNFFDIELGFDFLTILDGALDSAMIIGQYSGTNNPGIVTSSQPDGCLTFVFGSDNLINDLGWEASVDCSSTAGVNDTICSGTECPGECGTWICETGLYPTENIGNLYEDMTMGHGGCFDNVGEVASQWFYFTALTSGTVELSFAGPGGQNYNFAIYGPSLDSIPPCPQTSQMAPVICSQADVSNYLTNGLTGLSSTIGDGGAFEGPEGDGWVAPLNVIAGESYSMVVNIYQNGGPQPVIDLTIGGTGELNCSIAYLPVELVSFNGVHLSDHNRLTWITESEINNDYFTIERSVDGHSWEVVDYVNGTGTTQHSRVYSLDDYDFFYPVTYYRLSQTDYDGTHKIHEVIAVNAKKTLEGDLVTQMFPNPSESYATFMYNGHDSENTLNVTLVDQFGKVIYSIDYDQLYKGMPGTIRTDELASGLYQVIFTLGSERQTQKLSIMH